MNKKILKIFASSQILGFLLIAAPAGALTFPGIDQQARTRFQEAKQNYATTTGAYQNAKRALTQVQTQLKSASQAQQNALRTKMEERTREFLANSVNSMTKYLEAMKNKAGNARGIADDDKEKIINELENEISWLQAKSAEIKTAPGERLSALKEQIQTRWRLTHRIARRLTGQIMAFRIKFVIEKSETFGAKIEVELNTLKDEGKDVAALQAKLAEFRAKIAAAKEQYNLAKEKFQSVTSAGEIQAQLQAGQNYVKEANRLVKEAHVILVQLTKEIKKLMPKEQEPAEE